jgi:hypothetical protein
MRRQACRSRDCPISSMREQVLGKEHWGRLRAQPRSKLRARVVSGRVSLPAACTRDLDRSCVESGGDKQRNKGPMDAVLAHVATYGVSRLVSPRLGAVTIWRRHHSVPSRARAWGHNVAPLP